ncbi:UDP binding domain-containing protein [Bacillus sp. JCM 19041]|uniref:UDP binding domain-containing protein n=1 Tax=Bacillus sp. JCM 19041 TaxID=1460637 RepID=UPI000A6E49D3
MSYKKDLNDVRSSPSVEIMRTLLKLGAKVTYHDPHVPKLAIDQQTHHSLTLSTGILKEADIVVILTDHSLLPIKEIMEHTKLVYDTKNVTKDFVGKAEVIVLGGKRRYSAEDTQE